VWADTNILVRLAVQQPVMLFEAVSKFIAQNEAPILVHPAHICEAIFVLEGSVYQKTSEDAAQTLLDVLSSDVFTVVDDAAVMQALRVYPSTNLDFPDVLLAELARVDGSEVLTFDRKMARLGVPIRMPS
jgi:predicted nucleic-acid-binding protein